MAGASVFYPSRSIYPKVIGGGGPVPPSINIISPSFQNDVSLLGGVFRPYAKNQISTLQETNTVGVPGGFVAGTDPLPLNGNFGSFSILGNRVIGFNFINDFTSLLSLPGSDVQINATIASIQFSGGAPISGGIVQIAARISDSLSEIRVIAQNPFLAQTSTNSFLMPLNSETVCGLYFTGNKCGVIVNGIDNGFVQFGGSDMVLDFNNSVGFVLGQDTNVNSGDAMYGKSVSGGYVFQNTELSGLALPPGSWQDFGGNAI